MQGSGFLQYTGNRTMLIDVGQAIKNDDQTIYKRLTVDVYPVPSYMPLHIMQYKRITGDRVLIIYTKNTSAN